MSDKVETAGEVRKLRRKLGLCVDCGGPIEAATRGYRRPPIRCAACRERLTQMKYEALRIRMQREARRAENERRAVSDYRPPRTMSGAALDPLDRPSRSPAKGDLESQRDSNLERCEWATYVGSTVWYCPLAVCKLAKIVDGVSE